MKTNADLPELDRAQFSRESSRALDRVSIEEHGIKGLILMEHASIGIALAALERLPAPSKSSRAARVEVICGPGNNGGDGLAVARHLWNSGHEVVVWELVPEGKRRSGGDSWVQMEIVTRLEIEVIDASSALPPEGALPPDLRIDAIFGTGLSRPPSGVFRAAIERLNRESVPVLAVDVPSGLDADRGVPLDIAVLAVETVTLGIPKRGFLTPGAERFTGTLRCVPIGASRRLLPPGIPGFPPAPHKLSRSFRCEPLARAEPIETSEQEEN